MNRTINCNTLEVLTKAQLPFLGGSGTRMVTTDDFGNISAAPVPSGGGTGGVGDPASNGIMVRTALNTTLARTITGTANLITVTNGDGVSGNPTINVGANVATIDNTITMTNKTLGTGTKINLGTIANGDLYYGNASGDLVRIPIGNENEVFTVSTGIPKWLPAAGGGSAIAYFSAADFAGSNTLADPIRLANGNGFTDPGSNGLLCRIAANTVVPRSILGTSNLITVSNSDGVAGAPTISIGTLVARLDSTQTFTGAKTFSTSITVTGSTNGLILQSPNGSFWRIQVTDAGTLTITNTGA